MANRTAKDAHTIHGSNPQFLVEKIIRTRIYECKYWKEECFALTGTIVALVCAEVCFADGGRLSQQPCVERENTHLSQRRPSWTKH
jgi:hypothetical protein